MARGQSRKGMPRGRGKLMAEATFASLWNDPAVHVTEIAERLGISRQAVAIRARVRGLPKRAGWKSSHKRVEDDAPGLAEMWLANVGVTAMAAHFGCSHTGIMAAAERLGLPKRKLSRWDAITVDDFRAAQLREAMARSAREEQAALRLAEMVDGIAQRRAA
jgi:hypothetical protein